MGIKESALSVIASLTDSDFIRAVTAAGESRKIQATGVGKYAVETYSGSTLAGSAQSVQNAVNGLQSDIATLNTNLINKLKKSLIVGTASGSIASFNNGSDIFPALKCVAKIEPNQDLHGYDKPWVGGVGKNKFDKDNPNVVNGYITSSAFSDSNTKARTIYIPIKPNTTYTVSKVVTARFAIATSSVIPTNGAAYTSRQIGNTDTSLTITSGASDAYLWAWVYLYDTDTESYNDVIDSIQIEEGSSATTWTPYSNICPISGWSGVNVDVNGTTISVSWSGDAGTVYGGTVDVVSGELTVTHAIKDLGTLTWTYQSGSTRFYAVINDRKLETSDAVKPNMICSAYDCISVNDFNNNNTNGAIRGNTQSNTIFLRNTDYTDGAALKTALSGTILCYELATPTTYTLTAQQVDILLGDNIIFANTGPMDPVEYYADATITIQNLS